MEYFYEYKTNPQRSQLIVLARRKNARITNWSREIPTDWRPRSVRNPHGDFDTHFSNESAWELIASELEACREVEIISLDKLPGAKGYVMLIELEPDASPVYVKVQLRGNKVIGRKLSLLRNKVRGVHTWIRNKKKLSTRRGLMPRSTHVRNVASARFRRQYNKTSLFTVAESQQWN